MNVTKIMSKDGIMRLNRDFPVGIVRDVAAAILSNDVDMLNKYVAKATLINGVVDVVLYN